MSAELDKLTSIHDSIPKTGYADFVLWLCLTFVDAPMDEIDVLSHPFFMTRDEYNDWTASALVVKNTIKKLINPLKGN